jgi:peptidoglycan/LPS O-acetylase OafA/YrhL
MLFMSGALVAATWSHVASWGSLGFIGAFSLALATSTLFGNANPVFGITFAASIIYLCNRSEMGWFARGGDASYGIYIFAFPIQQISIIFISGFWSSMTAAAVATLAISYACWHSFESYFIKRRAVLEGLLRMPFQGQGRKPLSICGSPAYQQHMTETIRAHGHGRWASRRTQK